MNFGKTHHIDVWCGVPCWSGGCDGVVTADCLDSGLVTTEAVVVTDAGGISLVDAITLEGKAAELTVEFTCDGVCTVANLLLLPQHKDIVEP